MDTSSQRPGCVDNQAIFQHPLVEEPPAASAPAQVRARARALLTSAEAVCRDCQLRQECLYEAVVHHDVAGFVGGTTPRQRDQLRQKLRVRPPREDLDALVGGGGGGRRQVDHDEILRLRRANPHETLESLARRVDCSLSTVKRHLRRGRDYVEDVSTAPGPESAAPAVGDVTRAVAEVTRMSRVA